VVPLKPKRSLQSRASYVSAIRRGLAIAPYALLLAACAGARTVPSGPQPENLQDPNAMLVRISIDSTSYRARLDPFGLYVFSIGVTLDNVGPGPVYLERLCQTLDSPAADFVRPAGNTQVSFLVTGGICDAVGYPDSGLPAPIAIAPGGRYNWKLKASSIGARGQIPEGNVTGDFQLRLPIIANNHRGTQVKSTDYLPPDRRLSALFTVLAPP